MSRLCASLVCLGWMRVDAQGRYGPGNACLDVAQATWRRLALPELARPIGLSLLTAFTANDSWLGNAELARRTGLPKATVTRLSATLVALGYLRRNSKGQFTPGLQLLSLAAMALGGLPLRRLMRPKLLTLAAQFEASVCVATLQQDRVIWIDEVHSPTAAALHAPQAEPLALTRSAVVPALLSLFDTPQQQAMLARLAAAEADPASTRLADTPQALADCQLRGYCWCPGTPGTRGENSAVIGVPLMVLPNGLPLALTCTAAAPGAAPEPEVLRQQTLSMAANIRAALHDALR